MEDVEMIDFSFLTQKDVKNLEEKIGFTADEQYILEHLVKNYINDDGMRYELRLHRNQYYQVKRNGLYKIVRHATQT